MIRLDGFPINGNVDDSMIQLSDLAIAVSPDVLRSIANFFLTMAEEIESESLQNYDIHIASRILHWTEIANTIDIQLINPKYTGPAIDHGELQD